MTGVDEFQGFYAVLDKMPGPDQGDELRIGGTVVFVEGGWSARLERFKPDGPTGINSRMLTVSLVIEAPSGPVPQVITAVELEELCISRPGLDYLQVQFRTEGHDGPPRPPVVDVEVVS
jgi:hypothetical protein